LRDLAAALEAEAACVWSGWAGALVVAAAACVAGEDRRAIAALPDPGGRPNRVVLQRGHVLDLGGGSLPQLLRLGGAMPVEVGAADRCGPEDLDAGLADAAAALFVASASAAPALLPLAPFVWRCRRAGRPAVVAILDGPPHAAALDAGAGLVVLDGTALGGPPCGITAGAAPLVRACLAQERGVGRALLPRPDDADRLAAALAAR
jgi:D-glucosaminate-6-phosphate ammonia-lyase